MYCYVRGPRKSASAKKCWTTRRKNGTDKVSSVVRDKIRARLQGKQVAWNKGLTRQTDARVEAYSQARIATNLQRYGRADGPRQDTWPERQVEARLQEQNKPYLKQLFISGISVDFYLPETKTVIFVDGCYYHNCTQHHPDNPFPDNTVRDRAQDECLSRSGYQVVRIWEHDIRRENFLGM